MSAATQETMPAKPRGFIRIPDLRVTPTYEDWTELRRKRRLARYRDDSSVATVERDRERIKRAALTHAAACNKKSDMSFVDPACPNLDPERIARERERWTKLIYDEAVRVDRESRRKRTKTFWFAATIIHSDYFVEVDAITPDRTKSLRRRHARCFSNLEGGVFEAGWIDISLNTEINGARYWSLHVHSLIGVEAESEANAKCKLNSAYATGKRDPRVKKPVQFRRTYLTAPPKKKLHAIGWLAYCFRSARPGGILRGGKWQTQTGEVKKAKGPLQPAQLAEILPQLAKLTFADRRVICGARYARGRLATNRSFNSGKGNRDDAANPSRKSTVNSTISKAEDLDRRFHEFSIKLIDESVALYHDGLELSRMIPLLATGIGTFAVDAKLKPKELEGYLRIISVVKKSRFAVRVEKCPKKAARSPKTAKP